MKISKTTKVALIVFSVLLCIVAGILVLHHSELPRDPSVASSQTDTSGKVVVHQFGQSMFLHYRTSHINGPAETSVNLFLSENETAPVGYISKGDFVMPEITLIYQKNGLVCYEWSDQYNCFITYRQGNSQVKAYPNYLEKSDDSLLYPVAKQEFMTKDWRRIEVFGEMLLKGNDPEAKETLKKYAANSFTSDEISQNEKSNKVTVNDIQTFAQSLSAQYKF